MLIASFLLFPAAMGMTQGFFLEDAAGGSDQRRMAQRIRESGEHLNRLLTDVLDVSRIEAGRLELQLEDVTARSLAEEVRARFEPQAAAKGLAFEVQISGEADLALRADEERLMQLARVFVSNAIRFTNSSGRPARARWGRCRRRSPRPRCSSARSAPRSRSCCRSCDSLRFVWGIARCAWLGASSCTR